jgi:magnesium-transporting ATPase (P-type)
MIKRRNLWLMVLWTILTFGIYGIYWYYQTSDEIIRASGEKANPLLWTLLLFIPPIHVLSFWFYSQALGRLTHEKNPPWLIFLLFVFLPFLAWIPVQLDLNELAGAPAPPTPALPA